MSLEQRQRFVVEGLPSIGETLARGLLERFGSVRAVFSATEEELKKVPKIGDIKAAEIVRLSNAPYDGDHKHLQHERSHADSSPWSFEVRTHDPRIEHRVR